MCTCIFVTVCYTSAQTCATNVKRLSNQNCSAIRNRNVPKAARQEQCSDERIENMTKRTNMSIADATAIYKTFELLSEKHQIFSRKIYQRR